MAAAFPRRLFEILTDEDKSVICWNPDGKSFRINDPTQFCNDILPRYYRHCKLTSFQRQLNLYGFQRVHVGPLGGAYYHPHFQRDNFALIMNMKRAIKKGSRDDQGEQSQISPTPSSSSSSSLQFLDSFPSMPTESMVAARRASDAAELAVTTAAEVMAAMVTPFVMDPNPANGGKQQQAPQDMQDNNEDNDYSTQTSPTLTAASLGGGGRGGGLPSRGSANLKGASVSSMNSDEWLRAADLHVDSRASMLSVDKPPSDNDYIVNSDEVRKFSYSRRNSSEMSDYATLMDFDINQLEDPNFIGNKGRRSASSSLSPTNGQRQYQVSQSDEYESARKYQKDINGVANQTSWESIDEKSSPTVLSQIIQDAATDGINTTQYGELADELTNSIGSRKALTLVLSLLARTAVQGSYSGRRRGGGGGQDMDNGEQDGSNIEGCLDSLDPEKTAAVLHNLSLHRKG